MGALKKAGYIRQISPERRKPLHSSSRNARYIRMPHTRNYNYVSRKGFKRWTDGLATSCPCLEPHTEFTRSNKLPIDFEKIWWREWAA
jgi:hypothetical protein